MFYLCFNQFEEHRFQIIHVVDSIKKDLGILTEERTPKESVGKGGITKTK